MQDPISQATSSTDPGAFLELEDLILPDFGDSCFDDFLENVSQISQSEGFLLPFGTIGGPICTEPDFSFQQIDLDLTVEEVPKVISPEISKGFKAFLQADDETATLYLNQVLCVLKDYFEGRIPDIPLLRSRRRFIDYGSYGEPLQENEKRKKCNITSNAESELPPPDTPLPCSPTPTQFTSSSSAASKRRRGSSNVDLLLKVKQQRKVNDTRHRGQVVPIMKVPSPRDNNQLTDNHRVLSMELREGFKEFLTRHKIDTTASQREHICYVSNTLREHYGGFANASIFPLKTRSDIQQLPEEIKPSGGFYCRKAWRRFLNFGDCTTSPYLRRAKDERKPRDSPQPKSAAAITRNKVVRNGHNTAVHLRKKPRHVQPQPAKARPQKLSNKEKHEEYLQVKISPTLIHSFKRFLQKIFKVAKAKSQLDQVNAVKYVLLDHYGGAVNVPNLKSRDDIQQLPKDIKPLGEHHVRAWKRFLEFADCDTSLKHEKQVLQQHRKEKPHRGLEGTMRRTKRNLTCGPHSGCQTHSSKLMSLLINDAYEEDEEEQGVQKEGKKDKDDDDDKVIHCCKKGKGNDGGVTFATRLYQNGPFESSSKQQAKSSILRMLDIINKELGEWTGREKSFHLMSMQGDIIAEEFAEVFYRVGGDSSGGCEWLKASFDALLVLIADVAEAARRKKEERQQNGIKEILEVLANMMGSKEDDKDLILGKAEEMIEELDAEIKKSQDEVRQHKIALFHMQADSNKASGRLTARMKEVQTAILECEERTCSREDKKKHIEELILHVLVLNDMLGQLGTYPERIKKDILEARDLMEKSILTRSYYHYQQQRQSLN